MTQGRLLHMGGVVVDLVLEIERLPEAGDEVVSKRTLLRTGGGMNILSAAQRCGLASAYGGRHGTGMFGDAARRSLTAAGISILQPATERGDTGTCIVLVTPDGERTFISHVGVEGSLDPETLDTIVPQPGDWIYVSGYTLGYPDSGPALARWLARLPGEPSIIFDPGPLGTEMPSARLDQVFDRCTWLSCNGREAALLTGMTDPVLAASTLATRLRRAEGGAVVRTGRKGCVLATADGGLSDVPGFVVDAIDTNGAGDTHVGAFIAALARGARPFDAAVFANAAAALAVTRRGPDRAPTREEVQHLVETRPSHSRSFHG
ncbi:MAG TPA: PfkB family carbohydrate kinase [Stellaceae bacterium]|nr:PfkB family carbohydrate kinase [Stellaceae bacterium]